MATLGGTDLGDIQSEQSTKDTSMFSFPLPASDSASTILLDIFGVTRVFSIDGIYEDATFVNIQNWIDTIEGYANGGQLGKTYVSNMTGDSYTVYIQSFSWTYSAGDPSKISYSLQLIEGAGVS